MIREDMLDQTLLTAARTAPLETVIAGFLSETATYLGALYLNVQLLELDYPAQSDNCAEIYQGMKDCVEHLWAMNRYILADIVAQRIRDECDPPPAPHPDT